VFTVFLHFPDTLTRRTNPEKRRLPPIVERRDAHPDDPATLLLQFDGVHRICPPPGKGPAAVRSAMLAAVDAVRNRENVTSADRGQPNEAATLREHVNAGDRLLDL